MEAYDHFVESIHHFAARNLNAAYQSARRAHEANPDELLYADAARWLEKNLTEGAQNLYAEGDAFSAFISSGSNLPLYDGARALLTERLQAIRPRTVLDIGTGVGSITVPVLSKLDPRPYVTFCEPSIALLDRAIDFADDVGLEVEAYPYPIEDVLEQVEGKWNAAIATWSLQNLPPTTRAEVLQSLARQTTQLFLAEFDDRSGRFDSPLDPARIRHIHDRYTVGVREFEGDEGRRVRHGFLLPVMYGYFGRDGQRSTYEQPIAWWERELVDAGFTIVQRTIIYPYWWADAYLVEAVVQDPDAGSAS